MEIMRNIFEYNRKSTSYKPAIIKGVASIVVILFILYVRCFLHFHFENDILELILKIFLVVILYGAIMCFYTAWSEINQTSENLKKQMKKKDINKVDFVVVKFSSIIVQLKSADVVRIEAIIQGEYCEFGATSSSYGDGPLINKQYYIGDEYFDKENEKEYIAYVKEKLDSDTVNIISIDYVEAANLKKYGYDIEIV